MNYAINLSPQVDTLDGRQLDQLTALWLADIQRHSLPLTHATYSTQINRARTWWREFGDTYAWQLSRETLLDFARHLDACGYSWHTQNDALRRLRSCLLWARDRGYIPLDCSTWVPSPVGDPPRMRKRAQLDDLVRLLDAAGEPATGLRDRAIVAVLIGTGLRRAECALLDVEDVQIEAGHTGTIAVHHAKRVKGRLVQARLVAMDAWTTQQLLPWLDSRPRRGPLWVQLSSDKSTFLEERLGIDTLGKIVMRAARRAGLTTISGPHDLRRHFATWFAAQHRDNALAARLLSRQLGHSRFTMTDRYILEDIEDLRTIIRSPLADSTP